jgi:hypothetical protein
MRRNIFRRRRMLGERTDEEAHPRVVLVDPDQLEGLHQRRVHRAGHHQMHRNAMALPAPAAAASAVARPIPLAAPVTNTFALSTVLRPTRPPPNTRTPNLVSTSESVKVLRSSPPDLRQSARRSVDRRRRFTASAAHSTRRLPANRARVPGSRTRRGLGTVALYRLRTASIPATARGQVNCSARLRAAFLRPAVGSASTSVTACAKADG